MDSNEEAGEEFKDDLLNPSAIDELWKEHHEGDNRQPCGMSYVGHGQPIRPIDTHYADGPWAARDGHGEFDTECDYLHGFGGQVGAYSVSRREEGNLVHEIQTWITRMIF